MVLIAMGAAWLAWPKLCRKSLERKEKILGVGNSIASLQAAEQIVIDDNQVVQQLAGEKSSHLKIIEKQLGVRIHQRGNQFSVQGERALVELALRLLTELARLLAKGYPLYPSDIVYAARILSENIQASLQEIFLDKVFVASNKRAVTPKSLKQKEYIDAIRQYDIVFGIGPAGTGKTYLAMAMAVAALSAEQVRRIILVRPAVEAGEKLGFLPGDLHDMMDFERASRLLQRGAIEVAPLAFMRGRTLNDAFVILDEAQNTTSEQMKMFLTRLGLGSKAVITGDITQIDLPLDKSSGLIEAKQFLKEIQGISFVYFTNRDVVRHRLVQEIIQAYERVESRSPTASKQTDRPEETA
jgi:phosphate starvation-inducible PhoH-like protein